MLVPNHKSETMPKIKLLLPVLGFGSNPNEPVSIKLRLLRLIEASDWKWLAYRTVTLSIVLGPLDQLGQ